MLYIGAVIGLTVAKQFTWLLNADKETNIDLCDTVNVNLPAKF